MNSLNRGEGAKITDPYHFPKKADSNKSAGDASITQKADVVAKETLEKNKEEIQQTKNLSKISKDSDRNEPDIDSEMEDELDRVLTRNLCKMPSDSEFNDTDLIILKDKYTGSMPINGIKKKDFKKITLLLNKICEGSSNLKIASSDPGFLNQIKEAIKI